MARLDSNGRVAPKNSKQRNRGLPRHASSATATRGTWRTAWLPWSCKQLSASQCLVVVAVDGERQYIRVRQAPRPCRVSGTSLRSLCIVNCRAGEAGSALAGKKDVGDDDLESLWQGGMSGERRPLHVPPGWPRWKGGLGAACRRSCSRAHVKTNRSHANRELRWKRGPSAASNDGHLLPPRRPRTRSQPRRASLASPGSLFSGIGREDVRDAVKTDMPT